MRYIAAAALHQKALNVLSVIEDAEERMKNSHNYFDRISWGHSNWREELRIWPLGKPSAAEQERERHKLAITKAAHARLCKYYQNILSRLIDIS